MALIPDDVHNFYEDLLQQRNRPADASGIVH